MPRVETHPSELTPPTKKRMEMGLWLTILFLTVLLVGFGLMLVDVLLG